MLKGLLNCSLVLAMMATVTACEEPASNQEYIVKLQDTLFKMYPTVNRVSVEVIADEDRINITIGDQQLYGMQDNELIDIAKNMGRVTDAVFTRSRKLKKGNVIFIKEEGSADVAQEDKKIRDLELKQE